MPTSMLAPSSVTDAAIRGHNEFAGYKACFERGMTEIGCMVHARHKFLGSHANYKSQLAKQALHSITSTSHTR